MSGGDPDRPPEEQLNAAAYSPEDVRRVERAFLRLRRKHRQILLMARVEKLTYAQMAARLGITIKQVERGMADMIYAWDRAMEREEAEEKRPWWRLW